MKSCSDGVRWQIKV